MEPTTHPFNREEVMAYLDGELAPERASAAAAHLEQCAECRALVASLRSLSAQLPQWQVEPLPATVEQRVLQAAEKHGAQVISTKIDSPAPARRGVRWLIWGSALGVAALLLIAINLPVLHRSRESVELAGKYAASGSTDSAPVVAPAPSSLPKTTRPSFPKTTPPSVPPRPAPQPPAVTAGISRDEIAASRSAEMDRSFVSAGANAVESKKALANQPSRAEARATQATQAGQEPMIIRRATLAILTKEFDAARAALENLVKAHQGYFGQLDVAAPASQGRALSATVRVPAAQLDSVLIELRKLGKVQQENQTADDVTRQYVDLVARLSNARETEKRLVEILRERTGRVSDVLEVEQQIAATRQQIEQMEAERKNMDSEVRYASVDLSITEEYKQSLETQPAPSLGTRLNNATVDGLRAAAELMIGLVLWLLGTVPTLAVLGAMLAWPVLLVVRRFRRWLAPTGVVTAQ